MIRVLPECGKNTPDLAKEEMSFRDFFMQPLTNDMVMQVRRNLFKEKTDGCTTAGTV